MAGFPRPLVAVTAAAAALAGAAFFVHSSARPIAKPVVEIAPLSLNGLSSAGGPLDARLLDVAFSKVEDTYYKPVSSQMMLDGERRELIAYLRHHGVRDPHLPHLAATGNREEDRRLFDQSLQTAQSRYGAHLSNDELTQTALRGMLGALDDPYTTYLSQSEIDRLEESLRGGDFGGIGVYMAEDPHTKHVVVDPIEGTPAFKAGIKPGDEIISVDGSPTKGLALDDIERLIRGRIGTVVTLVIQPHDSKHPRTVPIVRGHIQVPSVYAKMEDGDEYIRLADFGQTSYDEVRHAILNGEQHHAQGYILDLRNNGGGLLDAAVHISSLFIPNGTIVSTIDRNGIRDVREATHEFVGAKPLVLLVNRYTASASEITAGAVQDYKVGTLIGERTFGKGVVQSIYSLGPADGALKITTARYVTPLGRDIQHKGIRPDIVITQPIGAMVIDTPRDTQLLAAKQLLRRSPGNKAHGE